MQVHSNIHALPNFLFVVPTLIGYLILFQYHMVTAHGNLGDHQFGAKPQNWPLMGKTLPYWLDETSNVRTPLTDCPRDQMLFPLVCRPR